MQSPVLHQMWESTLGSRRHPDQGWGKEVRTSFPSMLPLAGSTANLPHCRDPMCNPTDQHPRAQARRRQLSSWPADAAGPHHTVREGGYWEEGARRIVMAEGFDRRMVGR